MDSTPTPSTPESASGRQLIVTRLLNDPGIGSKLRADLKVARHDWPVYEEVGADMIGELIGARHPGRGRTAVAGVPKEMISKMYGICVRDKSPNAVLMAMG